MGPSDLEGYGLFAGEDVSAQNVHIGEYKGEVINEHEASMRGLLYGVRSRSFLFDLTRLGVVDGLRLGDKVCGAASFRNPAKQSMADALHQF